MTCIPGRLAKIQLSADGGLSYIPLGGIVDVTMNLSIDELECTTHDSNGAREYIPNHHDVTLDVSARWFDGDPGQEMLLDSAFAKTSLLFIFTMQTLTGKKKFTGSCFPTSASPAGPLDDTGSFDVTLRASGVIKAVQA
jgi:predicted secreted protein